MQPIETGKNNNQSCLNQVQKVRELFMLDCTAYSKYSSSNITKSTFSTVLLNLSIEKPP
jgi:hypothetical protein